jgi:hypothetical protein
MVYTAAISDQRSAISGLTVKGLVTHAHAIARMRYVKL